MHREKIDESKFAKVGVDINDGDVILLLDEGKSVVSTFNGESKEKQEFSVKLPNGKVKTLTLNTRSYNNLIDDFGEDADFAGRAVRCEVSLQNVRGEMRNVLTLHGGGAFVESDPVSDTKEAF